MMTSGEPSTELSGAECWHLLGHSGIGRVALEGADGRDDAPVSYLTHNGCVYFRSASPLPLAGTGCAVRVALSCSGDPDSADWKVVVHGWASPLISDQGMSRSGLRQVRGYQAGENEIYFELRPDRITGCAA